MAINFPATPTLGQKFPLPAVPGVPTYTWDGEKWVTKADAIGGDFYVEIAGGTMTGSLTLSGDPTDPLHATTKQYVDGLPAAIDMTVGLPVSPDPGALWWESDTGKLFVYYVDPSGPPGQWVEIAGASIPPSTGTGMLRYDIAQVLTRTERLQVRGNFGKEFYDMAGLNTRVLQVPPGAIAARFEFVLQPGAANQYPMIQLSTAPGVFHNAAGQYSNNGFSVQSDSGAVLPLNNNLTLVGLLLANGQVNNAIPTMGSGTVQLKRASTAVFFQSHIIATAVNGYFLPSHFTGFLAASATTALDVLAFRVINSSVDLWGANSFFVVEWY